MPAVTGLIPDQMVRAISAFMNFCYLVCRSSLDEADLLAMDQAVELFHAERVVFEETGVRPTGISLPRQHAMMHYCYLTQQFGAPNGLCSSITESKHCSVVKQPWCRSSRNQPLGEMLLINQHLDKLHFYRMEKIALGLLGQSLLSSDYDPVDPLPTCDHDMDNFHDDSELGEVEADEDQRQNGIVELAGTQGMLYIMLIVLIVLILLFY